MLDHGIDLRRYVLVKGSAKDYVHKLLAAADGQYRLAGRQRSASKQKVAAVTDRIDAHRFVENLLAVLGRIEVRTAGEYYAIQFSQKALSQGRIVYDGKDDGDTSRTGNGVSVSGREVHSPGSAAAAADPDQRSGLFTA